MSQHSGPTSKSKTNPNSRGASSPATVTEAAKTPSEETSATRPSARKQRGGRGQAAAASSVRRRVPSTRVFGRGYNINYQFGVDTNDNYSSAMIELEWCRGLNISYICSGITHSLYLSFTGDFYFCGEIDAEKLGLALPPQSEPAASRRKVIRHAVPEPMASFSDSPLTVSRIADGVASRHLIVISSDFRAHSMGSNHRGQLGLGHYRSTRRFEAIEFRPSAQDMADHVAFDVIDASAGESHSAFVLMPRCSLPIAAILNYFALRYALQPMEGAFQMVHKLVSRFLIRSNSLLTEPRGRLYVVGCNDCGQLGLSAKGSSAAESISRPLQVGGLSAVSIAQVSCGEKHTVCLDNRGRVYCFGDNYYGQSGCHLNHYENVHFPLKVEHFKKQYAARIVKVSSGKYHCVALDKLGRVFCWGLGAYGQLGANKLSKRVILPLLVGDALADKKVCDVRAGMYHTIAVTNRAKLYCWGSNNFGQCFQSQNTETIVTPKLARISNERHIYKAFCGYYSTMVLTYETQQ